MQTRTVLFDGKKEIELKDWDAWNDWKRRVIKYFESVKDYAGYPSLPDFWLEGKQIYDRASKREQGIIAMAAMDMFMSCLQHWRSDHDTLYDPAKRKEFLEMIANCEKLGMNMTYTPQLHWE